MSNAAQQERAGAICKCGHDGAAHYSARAGTVRNPCHHRGAHDTRCSCRDYTPTPGAVRRAEVPDSPEGRLRHQITRAQKDSASKKLAMQQAIESYATAEAQLALLYDRLERLELRRRAEASKAES